MKKLFIYLGALGFSALSAQTLTQNTHQPEIGNVERIRQMDTTGFAASMPNGTAGTNSVWDFSSAVPLNSETLTNNYTSSTTFTNGVLFPGANICQDLPGNMFTYFKYASTPTLQNELVGIVRPDISMSFTNTGIVIQYPAGLGFTLSDDIAGTYSIGAINGPVTGETKTTADGTGTLILAPGVVFNDVIRVKCVQSLTLTQGTITGYVTQIVYNYYSASQKFPIVNISYISQTIGTGTPTVTAGMFANADNYATVGVNELSSVAREVQLFPNPASQLVHISAPVAVEKATLYNLTGQQIATQPTNNAVDISDLPNGIYYLKLDFAAGTLSKKVIVTH